LFFPQLKKKSIKGKGSQKWFHKYTVRVLTLAVLWRSGHCANSSTALKLLLSAILYTRHTSLSWSALIQYCTNKCEPPLRALKYECANLNHVQYWRKKLIKAIWNIVKLIRYQFWCTRCACRLIKSLQWYSGRNISEAPMLSHHIRQSLETNTTMNIKFEHSSSQATAEMSAPLLFHPCICIRTCIYLNVACDHGRFWRPVCDVLGFIFCKAPFTLNEDYEDHAASWVFSENAERTWYKWAFFALVGSFYDLDTSFAGSHCVNHVPTKSLSRTLPRVHYVLYV
jgi:hypothetical protein